MTSSVDVSDAVATPAPSAAASSANALVGRDVLLHSLAKRPELNGLCGHASSYDDDKGRLVVRLPGSEHEKKPLLLKPDNVTRAPVASTAIAACCAAEHADEVRERVEAVRAGVGLEGGMQHVLDLEHTGLRELPAVIGTLSLTQQLWLGSNELTALPSALGQLRALKQLDVDANCLATLPESIGALGALESLFANANRFTRLPAALGRLRALRELRLADNRLADADALPAELGAGPAGRSLRVLWLARNGLSALPACVCACTRLEELDLSGNAELTALPPALVALRKLSVLELDGVPNLVRPPADVAKRGAAAVRAWLADAAEAAVAADAATATGGPSPEVPYAHEPLDSMHRPMAPEDLGGVATAEGGGSFVFPGAR